MSKARSRLNLEKLQQVTTTPLPEIKTAKNQAGETVTLAKRYFKHSPTLFLSLPFGAILGFILVKVRPDTIKNLVWTNSYLAFITPFFLACLFLFSFIFLKTRRGLGVSGFLTSLVFLKLQQVIITIPIVLILILGWFLPLLIIEVFVRLFTKK